MCAKWWLELLTVEAMVGTAINSEMPPCMICYSLIKVLLHCPSLHCFM